jgi:predicted esterase
MKRFFPVLISFFVFGQGSSQEEPIPAIERRLPPTDGIEIPDDIRSALEERVSELKDRVWEIDFKEHAADVGVLVKAVDYALQHNEFYSEKEIPLATEMLDLAEARYIEIDENDAHPWTEAKGLIVRGFQSRVDDSYQPYGLEIPEGLDLSKPVPLLVWLHGRGDKVTDLHFLKRCLTKSQALGGFVKEQDEVIILHPFGRQCVGWKHAGETDLFEAIAAVKEDYPIDPDRIALAGFSMGGAGAWHIGAHYRDQFCAVHAGAGFAETKEYNNLTPDQYPADYVQTLWQVYDVPHYVRNFLNGPLLAYSGGEDKQKQAADLMERELAKVGHEMRHVIGEGMGHKYNEESVREIWQWLRECWEAGRPKAPAKVQWQTPTLRYPGYDWLQLTGLEKHWRGAEATGEWNREARSLALELKGVSSFSIEAGVGGDLAGTKLAINGTELAAEDPGFPVEAVSVVLREGKWTWGEPDKMRKRPGVQGPIDDAFLTRFIVVPPDRKPSSPKLARWVEFELDHFRSRWKALMRGDLPEKSSGELDSDDIRDANLILWGDADSNAMIAEIADRLPEVGSKKSADGDRVEVFIYPNPLNPDRYIVVNSGLTFREGHDKTNSQQNPKLPDWAVISLGTDPDENSPGEILEAGFFNEAWK